MLWCKPQLQIFLDLWFQASIWLVPEFESDPWDSATSVQKRFVDFNAEKRRIVSFIYPNDYCANFEKIDWYGVDEKSSLEKLVLSIRILVLSLLPNNLELWFTYEVSLPLMSANLPCRLERITVAMSGLVLPFAYWMLVKLQKRIYRTVGLTLWTCFELSAHYQNVTSLSLFYGYCFGRSSS